MSTTSSSK